MLAIGRVAFPAFSPLPGSGLFPSPPPFSSLSWGFDRVAQRIKQGPPTRPTKKKKFLRDVVVQMKGMHAHMEGPRFRRDKSKAHE